MKLFIILFFIICSQLISQNYKDYYIYPNFTIDSSNLEQQEIKFYFTPEQDSSKLVLNIIDFNSNESLHTATLGIYNSPDSISFKNNQKNSLQLVSLEKISFNPKFKQPAFGYRLLSQQNQLRKFGKTLLVIDKQIYTYIKQEIVEYIEVLRKCGINCDYRLAPRSEDFNPKLVQETKDIIDAFYSTNKDLENIILIGRIPVAMSGRYTPDGHIDESWGCWPTDLYYATINGNWTDEGSDTLTPISFPSHKNIPSDGKFDNTYIPKNVDFNIGRIDMFNLPYFKDSEIDLIKNYLKKDIKFREGKIRPSSNAIMDYGFEDVYPEKFPTESLINYNALFGLDNFTWKRSRNKMDKEDYLFYWGAAPGGTTSIYDIIYSEDIAKQNFNSVFTSVFGSRAVEWNTENNILRSITASNPIALTSRWGCRPFFYTFLMGAGKTIGDCHTFSINYPLKSSGSSEMYRTVHQTLLGDPTLKIYYPTMVEGFNVTQNDNIINFSWINSEKAIAYNIYYKSDDETEYKLLNQNWIKDNSYSTNNSFNENTKFIIKSIEKVENNQGYYFEESMGISENLSNSIVRNGNKINFFPNPTDGEINFNKIVDNIKIIDILGNIVYESQSKLNKINLNTLNINFGTYFISYSIGNQSFIDKIIYMK